MEIEFEETPFDFRKLSEDNLKRNSFGSNYNRNIIMICITLLIIGILMMFIKIMTQDPLIDLTSFLISFLLIFFSVFIFIKLVLRKEKLITDSVKNSVKGKSIDSYMGQTNVIINEVGILKKNAFRKEQVKWEGIIRIAETDDHFFVYDSDFSAFIIPKRAFSSMKEMKKFHYDMKKYLMMSK